MLAYAPTAGVRTQVYAALTFRFGRRAMPAVGSGAGRDAAVVFGEGDPVWRTHARTTLLSIMHADDITVSVTFRKALGLTAAVLTVVTLLFYAITDPVEGHRGNGCKKEPFGLLELRDCGAALDRPLYVYSRFPRRVLGDCGFWSMGGVPNVLFCPMVHALR